MASRRWRPERRASALTAGMKWWGWGDPAKRIELGSEPGLWNVDVSVFTMMRKSPLTDSGRLKVAEFV